MNIAAVLVGGGYRRPGGCEAPRGDTTHRHAGHRDRHAARRDLELFGVRYSVHTSDVEADVGKSPMSGAKTKEVRSGLLVQWVNSLLSEQGS